MCGSPFTTCCSNRAKIRVREQSVGVLQEELKTQRERLSAGMVGALNVSRAEVALANEQPELIDAQTRLQNSYLRLSQLIGVDPRSSVAPLRFEAAGQLQYHPRRPDLNECLAYADVSRPEIRAREIDVEIENQQLILDRSETRPRVEAFTGYEVYSESDPAVGPEFNHGYVVGLNATWHIFDGFATRGRMQATRARRDAALHALEAARLSVASEVRSAFLDLQQADRVLQSETRNVQNADESLEIAKGNLGAGLGTQLDILQAASDVTRTRTTRLGAIYLHNVALARLARASAREPEALGFAGKDARTVGRKGPSLRGGRAPAAVPIAIRGEARDRAADASSRLRSAALVNRSRFVRARNAANAITLDAALATTLEKNPAIVEAKIALEQAAGRRLVLRSIGLPDLRIQGLAGVQGGKRAGEPETQPFAFARGFFTQPLFDAAIPASRRRGDIEVLLAQQRLNVAVVEQLHATRIAFYTALFNDSLARARRSATATPGGKRQHPGRALPGGTVRSRGGGERATARAGTRAAHRGSPGAATTARCSPSHHHGATIWLRRKHLRPDGELHFAPVDYDLKSRRPRR